MSDDLGNAFLWSEEFRPKCVKDCILPQRIKRYLQDVVNKGELGNMVFSGPAGCGKTSSAKALCEDLSIDYLVINASESGNIDTVRTKVRGFAGAMSLDGKVRCIILDEFDGSSNQSQGALRGVIEEFAANCRFIFTANFENKIIDAIKSRAPVVDFTFTKDERKDLVLEFDKRVKDILAAKKIVYKKEELAKLVMSNYPDFRKTLNLLQRYSSSGELVVTSLSEIHNDTFTTLIGLLRDKKFTDMRKWVAENANNDGATLRRLFFDKAVNLVEPGSIPQLVMFINQYDERESRVVDKEINTVAFLTEVMADIAFRS